MFATVVAAVLLFLGLRLFLPLTFVVAVVALWVRRFDVSRFRLTLGVLACKIWQCCMRVPSWLTRGLGARQVDRQWRKKVSTRAITGNEGHPVRGRGGPCLFLVRCIRLDGRFGLFLPTAQEEPFRYCWFNFCWL